MTESKNSNSTTTDLNLATTLRENEQALKDIFADSFDIQYRYVPKSQKSIVLVVYSTSLIDQKLLAELLLKPWLYEEIIPGNPSLETSSPTENSIAISDTKTATTYGAVADGILSGSAAIFTDGIAQAVLANLLGVEKRSVEEPQSESALRGPREGFTESIQTNIGLVRRRMKTTDYKSEMFVVGQLSKTVVVMTYLKGTAQEDLVDEVRKRLEAVDLNVLNGSGALEECIEDHPFSVFPQIQNTERPDIVSASLAEGKICIHIDGAPHALIVPTSFWTAFQAVDDYNERFMYSTFIRGIRMSLFLLSLYLPSLFVAITTFHPQLLPFNLLISIAAAREGVPFPAVIEAMIIEFVFEGLREAGIRLPAVAGSASTVSIVGALVIGQASVQAGILSAPTVVVVALTGIASFAIPRYNMGYSFRMLRFVMLICSGVLGLFGITMASLFLLIHLVQLDSFGVPYMSPIAPLKTRDLKDVFFRAPIWSLTRQPSLVNKRKKWRIPKNQKPG